MRTETIVAGYIASRRRLRGDLSEKTIRSYYDSARFAGEWFPPGLQTVQKSLQALRRMAVESERTHLRRLRTLGAYAEQSHGITNPFSGIPARPSRTQPKRVFSPGEYRQLVHACRDNIDIALLDLLFGTGIRIGEVPLHAWQVQDSHILVEGKTGPRYAAITPRDRRLLFATEHRGRLWVNRGERLGKPLLIAGLYTRWRHMVSRSGLTGSKLGTHTARRTFASTWVMAGGSMESLQPQLGHSSIRTTQIYVQGTPAWVSEKMQEMDPLGHIQRAAVGKTSGPQQPTTATALADKGLSFDNRE